MTLEKACVLLPHVLARPTQSQKKAATLSPLIKSTNGLLKDQRIKNVILKT